MESNIMKFWSYETWHVSLEVTRILSWHINVREKGKYFLTTYNNYEKEKNLKKTAYYWNCKEHMYNS